MESVSITTIFSLTRSAFIILELNKHVTTESLPLEKQHIKNEKNRTKLEKI